MRNLKMIVFVILCACTSDEQSFQKNDNQDVIAEISQIVNNPEAYVFLVPEKINPFEVTLDFERSTNTVEIDEHLKKSEVVQIPDEIVRANKEFRQLAMALIESSSSISVENYRKLAYAIEMKILASDLSNTKKEFLLKELALLKFHSELREYYLTSQSDRIQCDYECRWNACMEEKIQEAFDSANTWLETAYLILTMPEQMVVWNLACLYAAIE